MITILQKLLPQIKLNLRYLDSDANNAYIIQAADYVANAIYAHYECYQKSFSIKTIWQIVKKVDFFPRQWYALRTSGIYCFQMGM